MMHPIVAQMTPSAEQEPAIVQRGCDVVVTAGAGTGKTRTLVARYLSLLADGLPLRSMVAITFTVKAAREMRNRVRDEMRRYLERQDLAPDERERWQDRYRQLDAARIGTIHSLCSEILRAHPAEAGVDPRFEVLEEGQANILRARSLDDTLAWAADDPQVARLFPRLEERGLRDGLGTLLARRLDAGNAFANLPDDLLGHWQRVLSDRQQATLDGLLAGPEWQEALATLQASIPHNADDKMAIQRQGTLAAIQGAVGTLTEQLASLSGLDGINLQGGSAKSWPGGGNQLAGVKAALRLLRDLWREHGNILGLRLAPLDEALAQAIPLLHAAFSHACHRYEALKRQRHSLDFDDLEQGALQLLQQNEAVRARWQRQVQAIVVDEFQDTNSRQRDLVALLNGDGQRLFMVGDAKQSIYRFRGAEVTVFRRERQRIAAEGASYQLETSYRAHRDLVQGLNDLLRPVLGETADPDRPWAEPFAPLRPHRVEPGLGFTSPHIELHLTVGPKRDGALERAAAALAARLVELVEGGEHAVLEEGTPRPLDYGDVAILCRASTSFAAYEDALERAGVPFLTVAGRGFYGRPEIRDLLNALQALADPTDDLALVGLLRSPAFALSDAALFHLTQERDGREDALSLWDLLRPGEHGLTEDDGRRARRAVQLISHLRNQVGRTSVAEVLKSLLDGTDYRAALIQSGQTRAARNVAKLLADAHSSGIVSVGEFLEYVGSLRESGAREGEARATAEGAVQIMTVHAAKGLEFPVVVLGDVTQQGRERNDALIDADLGVVLPLRDDDRELCAVYRMVRDRARDQEDAESDRLLYVAATRAREKLILSGCVDLTRDGTPQRLTGWLGQLCGRDGLGLEERHIEHRTEGDRAMALHLQVGLTPVPCTIYEPHWQASHRAEPPGPEKSLPAPVPPPLLAPVRAGEETLDARTATQERTPPPRVWRVVPAVERPRAPAWVVGSLVHEALASWRFPGIAGPAESFDRWAQARAREHGIADGRQLVDAVNQTARLLRRFRDHPLYEEMDRAERRLHEVPYSLIVGGCVESGIMDALFLRAGRWTIVEFKTDEVRDRAAFETLLAEEDYVAQTRRYLTAAEQLLGPRPQMLLCMLNYGGTVYVATEFVT
ncbi:MAG: UvrD-helicase domain-containing protein [Chloroflexi bacterium]|nr:UvrD-helicase domain-containing protein [Chloroflexota bacterium]